MNSAALQRAVFVDRDGTLNVEKNYLFRPEDLSLITGVPAALAQLRCAGFLVVVVTNQSGVGRGYFSLDDVHIFHEHMQQQLLLRGASIDAFYVCPHHPQGVVEPYRIDCQCRKGKDGMLRQAARDLNVDLSQSFMIGDKDTDIIAGISAGCRTFLVKTGYGNEFVDFAVANKIPVVDDLYAAVADIINSLENQGR